MSRDLYANNNDFFKEDKEDIENQLLNEFKNYKKHKKSKKKNKKKQKKFENKRMRKMEKRITKRVTKGVIKKLEKYIKKYKESEYNISPDFFDGFIKQHIQNVIYQEIIQSLNTIHRLDENNSIIDVPYKEVKKIKKNY